MSSRPLIIPGQLMFDDPALVRSDSADDGVLEAAGLPDDTAGLEADAAGLGGDGLEAGADVEGSGDVDADAGGVAEPEPGALPALNVEVIRSKRRTKTAQARLVGGTVEIRIPALCSEEEEGELVQHFTAKFERARSTESIDLEQRAAELADQYDLPKPSSIKWVTNQQYRWGSCTPSDATIRLSDRLAEFPGWVIDYVLIHELAHLRISGHDKDFWALVEAYPLCERARGFLIAKGLEGDD